MVVIAVCGAVAMAVFEEDCFVCKVSGECDRRNAEAREGAFKSVESRKGASVSPCLATGWSVQAQIDRHAAADRRTLSSTGRWLAVQKLLQTSEGRSRSDLVVSTCCVSTAPSATAQSNTNDWSSL